MYVCMHLCIARMQEERCGPMSVNDRLAWNMFLRRLPQHLLEIVHDLTEIKRKLGFV